MKNSCDHIGMPDSDPIAECLATIPRLDGVPFLNLGDGWELAADGNQWILNKARKCKGAIKWQPISFMGSDKAVLVRVMKEKGVAAPSDANGAVNRFFAADPQKFLQWRDKVAAPRRERVAKRSSRQASVSAK